MNSHQNKDVIRVLPSTTVTEYNITTAVPGTFFGVVINNSLHTAV